MSKLQQLSVKQLKLDVENVRLGADVCSTDEECIAALYNDEPKKFKELVDNIRKNGFLEGENILVQQTDGQTFIVKEGNRRVSALKMLLSKSAQEKKELPPNIFKLQKRFSEEQLNELKKISCIVYDTTDLDQKKLKAEINNRHLGSKSGATARLQHPSFYKAKAISNESGKPNQACNLLDRYFAAHPGSEQKMGKKFNITVLEDFLKHLAPHLKYPEIITMVEDYPNPETMPHIDTLIEAIFNKDQEGIKILASRRTDADARAFLDEIIPNTNPGPPTPTPKPHPERGASTSKPNNDGPPSPPETDPIKRKGPQAPGTHTASAIKQMIKALDISASALNAQKISAIRKEINALVFKNNPLALCLLWRCIIELTAKQYCEKHHIPTSNNASRPQDKKLRNLLENIKDHLYESGSPLSKDPLAAYEELRKEEGDYSIDALNAHTHRVFQSPTFDAASMTITNTIAFIQYVLSSMSLEPEDSSAS